MVLPAYAGMFPGRSRTETAADGSPRVCGDVSRKNRPLLRSLWFSPRMRGCFWRYGAFSERSWVLPAYAGMFPGCGATSKSKNRSPRVCGDVSEGHQVSLEDLKFSPRMRGCFSVNRYRFELAWVLRVCGDVSSAAFRGRTICWFSPRMRGCFLSRPRSAKVSFVLPAYARGCFRVLSWCRRLLWVLPAYAGMFPVPSRINFPSGSSPRVRGDVSGFYCSSAMPQKFSPRMRGCFYRLKLETKLFRLLPRKGDNSTSYYL